MIHYFTTPKTMIDLMIWAFSKGCVQYIPVTNGRHQKTPMFGDQGFFERGHNVSFSRSREDDLTERLDGLVSIPEEWHKKKVSHFNILPPYIEFSILLISFPLQFVFILCLFIWFVFVIIFMLVLFSCYFFSYSWCFLVQFSYCFVFIFILFSYSFSIVWWTYLVVFV